MTPTEHEGTVAVDAAARVAYERHRLDHRTEFDDLDPHVQNMWRETVLAPVWAALEALPDRRAAVWDEGELAGRDNANDGYPDPLVENPYRAAS